MRQWFANLWARLRSVPPHVWLGLIIGVLSLVLAWLVFVRPNRGNGTPSGVPPIGDAPGGGDSGNGGGDSGDGGGDSGNGGGDSGDGGGDSGDNTLRDLFKDWKYGSSEDWNPFGGRHHPVHRDYFGDGGGVGNDHGAGWDSGAGGSKWKRGGGGSDFGGSSSGDDGTGGGSSSDSGSGGRGRHGKGHPGGDYGGLGSE